MNLAHLCLLSGFRCSVFEGPLGEYAQVFVLRNPDCAVARDVVPGGAVNNATHLIGDEGEGVDSALKLQPGLFCIHRDLGLASLLPSEEICRQGKVD